MFIVSYSNRKITQQFQYTINTFSRIYRIPCKVLHFDELRNQLDNRLLISYGAKIPSWQGKHIHIIESAFFGEGYLTQKSLPHTPLPLYKDLPVLFLGGEEKEPYVYCTGAIIETNIDLIASAFFLLTRYEEVVNNNQGMLDQHKRFPATASISYKANFLHRPLVNEYFNLLWEWINEFYVDLKKKSLWNGKDFALCLTHDIDRLQKYAPRSELRNLGSLVLKQRKPCKALARFADYVQVALHKRSDPFDNIGQIISLEEKYEAASTFFFMTEPDFSGGYCLDNPRVKRALRKIADSKAEIGFHAGYYSYNNYEIMQRQKAKLDKINIEQPGCRQHFLRWKTPDTWLIQEKCGVVYDATLCFADHEGFRAGICHPFQPFDLLKNRTINIWEIPLTIMDCTLSDYRGLSPVEGLNVIKDYINTVKKYHGVIVVLWHNTFFDSENVPGWPNIYEKVLEYTAQKGGYITNAKDLLTYVCSDYGKDLYR